jgi:hypothetical protein
MGFVAQPRLVTEGFQIMTLIRDLIHIPERVHSGDFVLQLSDGITRPAETVRDYVVAPQLKACFDEALKFIRSATDSRKSKACYLHGSFGSGKSHFMAVLDLLLGGNLAARSIPELAEVVERHNNWTQSKRFLMVPYPLRRQTPEVGATCGKAARVDLCGGRSATGVPTAIGARQSG